MGTNLIEEGLKFLVLGMTTVYIFLYLMILVLKIESKIIKKMFPNKKKEKSTIIKNPVLHNSSSEDEVIAVITAAITEYRKK